MNYKNPPKEILGTSLKEFSRRKRISIIETIEAVGLDGMKQLSEQQWRKRPYIGDKGILMLRARGWVSGDSATG